MLQAWLAGLPTPPGAPRGNVSGCGGVASATPLRSTTTARLCHGTKACPSRLCGYVWSWAAREAPLHPALYKSVLQCRYVAKLVVTRGVPSCVHSPGLGRRVPSQTSVPNLGPKPLSQTSVPDTGCRASRSGPPTSMASTGPFSTLGHMQ